MRSFKHFGALVAVFAFCAIGAASASAASTFTASATGTLTGKQTSNQVFTTAAGNITCTEAVASGTISSTKTAEQASEVEYKNCKANGVATAHVLGKAKYLFTANGGVHVENEITITVTSTLFTSHCTIHIISGQWFTTGITYTNGASDITVDSSVEGIHYNVTGGQPCGTVGEHSDGKYTGSVTVERVGGGSISWDA